MTAGLATAVWHGCNVHTICMSNESFHFCTGTRLKPSTETCMNKKNTTKFKVLKFCEKSLNSKSNDIFCKNH